MTRAVQPDKAPREAKAPTPPRADRGASASSNRALAFSAAAHVLFVAGFLGYAWFKPSHPATAVFELVSAEPARLGPPTPKAPEVPVEPAEPEPPAPEPLEPEAPAVTPKPKDAKVAAKPEPKKPARDSAKAARPAATSPLASPSSEKSGDSPVQITNSGDPGLGRWGARVKPLVQRHWNPAPGYDVDLPATTVLSFSVSVDEGDISNIKVVQSSGNSQLDEEGVRALKRQERLPVPRGFVSPGFSEDILQVRYEFIYKGY